MGLISELLGLKIKKNDYAADMIISRDELAHSVPEDNSKSKEDDSNVPEGAFINEKGEIEYKVVERVIHPNKIVCPDCGGITLEGLEYCDKCGGELF